MTRGATIGEGGSEAGGDSTEEKGGGKLREREREGKKERLMIE